MRQIGPYELIQPLGSGGMAEVWMGRRLAPGGASKTVAIKLLAAKHADNPEFRRMFHDGARLTMLLNNSNIVQVFDVGEHDGECYMVMEWVDGLNLSQLTKRIQHSGGHLAPVISVYIVAEVLRALSYAHGLIHEGVPTEVVHRDISPQNVMLSVSGEVKLMDFGIARLSTEDTSGVHIKGKLRYMPPEQLRGDARRATVDLFAVGAILHELLEGRRFRSQVPDEARLYGMILAGEVPQIELPGGHTLPRELEELRSGLLAANPLERIPSAKDALRLAYRWTGYRNCSLDLADLVQSFVGTESPRTSIVGVTPSQSQPSRPAMSSSAKSSFASQSSSGTDDAATSTDAKIETNPSTRMPPTVIVPAGATGPSLGLKLGIAGLVVLALGIGGAGIAYGVGRFGDDHPSDAQAQLADAQAPATAPSEPASIPTAPAAAALVAATPTAATPAPIPPAETPPPTPVATPEPAPPVAVAASDSKPKAASSKPTVAVELVANDYFYVEAKIAGKVYKLDPLAKTDLRAGSHAVYLRASSSDAWQRAGQIDVEAGQPIKIEMLDPPGVRVSKR